MTQTIELTRDYARQHMARTVPGAYLTDPPDRAWVLRDPTPRSAAVALRLFPELALDYPELADLRDLLAQDVRPFDNATPYDTIVRAPLVYEQLRAEAKDFFRFQGLDLGYMADVMRQHGGAYIGWERGLGKTLGACALIDELNAGAVLVVCPNTAKEPVWKAEIGRWLPNHQIFVLPNEKVRRERMLAHIRTNVAAPFVLIVHYEALAIIAGKKKVGKRTRVEKGWDRLGEWDLVIADEVHRIKETDSQMTKALKKVPTKMKLGLSGSIIQNHVEELFSPLQWLFPDVYRSKWRDWNDRFLDYLDGPYGKICIGVKLEQLEPMRTELGVFMVYRRKEDELDLPPKSYDTLFVDLSPSQRAAYDELLRTCEAELDDGTRIKAADGLVMLGRLRQIATGLDLLSDHVADSTKLDLAVDLIRDNEDEAFVTFGWYKASCRALADRLQAVGIDCFVVDGDVDHHERGQFIERFQAGEGRAFIGTLATLGESVTLHRANQVIRLDRHWNPALNIQAEDRVQRIGQTKPVTITDIIARDTVDEFRVQPAIANKEALRRLIFGGA